MIRSAYNLCDMDIEFYRDPEAVTLDLIRLAEAGTTRIYAGSYFCANYFLRWTQFAESFADLCTDIGLELTVVVPVPSNRTISAIKSFLTAIENNISEVVVNDYGMLSWCTTALSCPLQLGRLFMRQTRDPRYPELQAQTFSIPFSLNTIRQLHENNRVVGIEMDGFGDTIQATDLPAGMSLCVHRPWFMMSCDFICEDAAAALPVERKFRADQPCGLECSGVCHINTLMTGHQVYKIGRGIYAYQERDLVYNIPEGSDLRYIEFYPFTINDMAEVEWS